MLLHDKSSSKDVEEPPKMPILSIYGSIGWRSYASRTSLHLLTHFFCFYVANHIVHFEDADTKNPKANEGTETENPKANEGTETENPEAYETETT